MENICKQRIYTLLFGLIWIIAVTSGATEEQNEFKDYEVEMHLYRVSEGDWNSEGRDKFKTELVKSADSYCEGNPEKCYMKSGSEPEFETDDYMENNVLKEKAYLKIKFVLKLTSLDRDFIMLDEHTEDEYLNKKALEAITSNAVEGFRDETDMAIVEINGEDKPLPPDNTLNIAISVTAIAILIILIIVLLVLQNKCGTQDHELLAQKEEAGQVDDVDGDKKVTTARGGTVATLQSVVTDDQLPAKKEPPPGGVAPLQTTDM